MKALDNLASSARGTSNFLMGLVLGFGIFPFLEKINVIRALAAYFGGVDLVGPE